VRANCVSYQCRTKKKFDSSDQSTRNEGDGEHCLKTLYMLQLKQLSTAVPPAPEYPSLKKTAHLIDCLYHVIMHTMYLGCHDIHTVTLFTMPYHFEKRNS